MRFPFREYTGETWGERIYLHPPEHETDDTKIRFKNPDGSWGDWIDLILEENR